MKTRMVLGLWLACLTCLMLFGITCTPMTGDPRLTHTDPPTGKTLSQDNYLRLTEDGWNKPIGTWNPVTRLATVTQDVMLDAQVLTAVIITVNDCTIDGGGHTINITGFNGSMDLDHCTNVTLKNLTLRCALTVINCTDCVIRDVTAHKDGVEVGMQVSGGRRITLDHVNAGDDYEGPIIQDSQQVLAHDCIFVGNTSIINSRDIALSRCLLRGRTCLTLQNTYGMQLRDSRCDIDPPLIPGCITTAISITGGSGNTFTRNMLLNTAFSTAEAPMQAVVLSTTDRNTFTANTVEYAATAVNAAKNASNTVFIGNNCLYVDTGAYGAASNIRFYQPAPVGGNFWCTWTTNHADNNSDGFLDEPYPIAPGVQDAFPLADVVPTAPAFLDKAGYQPITLP